MILNGMWVRYYPILKGTPDTFINIWKTFTSFCWWQNKLSYLTLISHCFILTEQIIQYKTPNDDRKFVSKYFCNFDNVEDICLPVWVDVVMSSGVAVNETRSAYWFNFPHKHTLPQFLVRIFQKKYTFHLIYTVNENEHLWYQLTNNYKQVHPDSKMNLV